MTKFRGSLFALVALALLALPGCTWFLAGGVAAIVVALQPEEETASRPAVSITSTSRITADPGAVSFTLFDGDGDPCDIVLEYRVGTGAFHSATPGTGGDGFSGLSASPGGASHTVMWDYTSDPDVASPETLDVTIRITATDSTGQRATAESTGHVLGNAPPQVTSIALPAGAVSGSATLKYGLSDTQGDTAQIEIQFRAEITDFTWLPATPEDAIALSNLSTSAAGTDHLFPWDSDHADDLQGENALAEIRIRASDDGGTTWSAWTESSGFTPSTVDIRNDTAPAAIIGTMSAQQDGLVSVPYTITDAESDEVTVLVEYRKLGGSAVWRRATAGPGTSPTRIYASPVGVSGAFVWDTLKDGIQAEEATVRVTPSQADVLGLSATKDFLIGNQGAQGWVTRTPAPEKLRYTAAAAGNGKVYLVGGHKQTVDGVPSLSIYDPAADTWSSGPDMPTARYYLAAAFCGGKLYAIGGSFPTTGTMEIYDPSTNTWTAGPDMPTARQNMSCSVVDGKIYAMGGQSGSSYLDDVEAFDPVTNAWTSKAAMPTGRTGLRTAVVDGRIFAIGGYRSGTGFQAIVEVYDPAANTWEDPVAVPRALMASSRTNFGCFSHDSLIYAAGGSNNVELATVEVYDPVADAWTSTDALQEGRGYGGGAQLNGRFFWIAGTTASLTWCDRIETLDPGQEQWTGPLAPLDPGRSLHSMVALNGKIYAVGGRGSSGTLSDLDAYSPGSDTWDTSLADMPTPRWYMGTVAAEGKIFAIGGLGASYNEVEMYDPETDTWSTRASMPNPHYMLACAYHDGKIYALGGADDNDKVDVYDVLADSWAPGLDLPAPRSNHCAAVIDGRIVIVAGESQTSLDVPALQYDPVANTWSIGARIPNGRSNPACAVLNGKLYVTGGNPGDVSGTTDLQIYDPAADTWRISASSMITARQQHGSAVIDGKLYVFGGTDGATMYMNLGEVFQPMSMNARIVDMGSLFTAVSSGCMAGLSGRVYALTGRDASVSATGGMDASQISADIPVTGPFFIDTNWVGPAYPSELRREAACVTHNGRIYILGGLDASGAVLSAFERYDPPTNTWTVLTGLPTARCGAGAAVVDGKLYVYGGDTDGDTPGGKTSVLEVYDLVNDVWLAGPFTGMSETKSHFGFAGHAETGRLFAMGGDDGAGGFLSSMEIYDINGDAWSAGAPLPAGRRRCLALRQGQEIFLFGGEMSHPTAGSALTAQILAYHPYDDGWRECVTSLPQPLRDLAGCRFEHTWDHRDRDQTWEWVLFGGGFDGSGYPGKLYRFYAR